MTDTQGKKHSSQKQHRHRVRRLKIVLSLSSSYFAAAIITVLFTGSLALLSEAGHMLADVGGLVLALIAINYTRKPATSQRTYGFYRMEILASLVNSVVLVFLFATRPPARKWTIFSSHVRKHDYLSIRTLYS